MSSVLRRDSSVCILSSYREAIQSKLSDEWQQAMKDEIFSLNEKNLWKLVPLPANRKAIPILWAFDVNMDSNEVIKRYRACLVSKGFMQIEDVDFSDVFSPLVGYSTVRLNLALIDKNRGSRTSLDIKTASQNAPLDQKLYIVQPEGFEMRGRDSHVYMLLKAFYGLRQASRLGLQHLHGFLKWIDFSNTFADVSLYTEKTRGAVTIIML